MGKYRSRYLGARQLGSSGLLVIKRQLSQSQLHFIRELDISLFRLDGMCNSSKN